MNQMNQKLRRFKAFLLLALAVALVSSCATMSYRDIQRDFNEAVRADNVRIESVDALGAMASNSQMLYEQVILNLTDDFIHSLPTELKPNAYAIRSVAQWRTGKLPEARLSAEEGLKLNNVHESPRDAMVLRMIPALIIDQELNHKFQQSGRTISEQQYVDGEYQTGFLKALDKLDIAMELAEPGTPPSILHYLHFHRYRMLQNWRIVIAGIDDFAAIDRAHREAEKALGDSMTEAINSQVDKVPAGSPLRDLMERL